MKVFLKQSYIFILHFFYKIKLLSYKKIPIVINNFNRLTYLKILISDLQKRGYTNIIILDNASTYEPLLDFYRDTPIKIIYLRQNLGHLSLNSFPDLYNKIKYNFFVYSDPDLSIIDDCPDDFIEHFFYILMKNKDSNKVGFGLKIDDLSDYYEFKEKVINWENQYHIKKTEGGFLANIDTTFCLHQPFTMVGEASSINCIRTVFPYLMRHLPWYENSKQDSQENKFYKYHANSSASWNAVDLGVYNITKL